MFDADHSGALDLKAGEWVQVRSKEEIIATLDEQGHFENLPFMPEMFQYCGKTLQVFKSAHKTCDYIQGWSIRRIKNAVHLMGVRCDGAFHGGCQARCLIFWKEAWLKRAEQNLTAIRNLHESGNESQVATSSAEHCVIAATCTQSSEGATIYRCQVTDVPKFTTHMSFWDPRQYIQDLCSGNLASGLAGGTRAERVLEVTLAVLRLLQATLIGFFNEVQGRRQRAHYPFIQGTGDASKSEPLNLQPGELVEVRSRDEIMATLDKGQKNRGLWFDSEMLPYCGGIYRVLSRVNRIVDERTGRLLEMKNACIILDGVICRSEFHRLCPRAIYPYWRESWLKRASEHSHQLSNSADEPCREG